MWQAVVRVNEKGPDIPVILVLCVGFISRYPSELVTVGVEVANSVVCRFSLVNRVGCCVKYR